MHDYTSRDTAFYTPLSKIGPRLPSLNFNRVLAVKGTDDGQQALQSVAAAKETRWAIRKSARNLLEDGLYVFKRAGLFDALIITGCKPERFAEFSLNANHVFPEANSLASAEDFLDETWDSATSTLEGEHFEIGNWVELVGQKTFGLVTDHFQTIEGQNVEIEIDSARKIYGARSLKKLIGDPRSPKTWISQSPAGVMELTNVVTWAKLKYALSDTLYSFAATRTVFRPYQFLPALKILNSERGRLLVADEVGLGKTIEAGLIWAELDYRHGLKRVLIVAPASLSFKWKNEMRRRFMRDVTIWNSKGLDEFLDKYEDDPDAKCAAVISVEGLRSADKQLKRIQDLAVDFDLVIFDEAHSARNKGTRTSTMASVLSDLTNYLVFLSATPLNLGQNDFFNLMHLLEPYVYQDPGVFRDQIAPNKYLNEVERFYRAGEVESARLSLDAIQNLSYGQGLVERPKFHELSSLIHSDTSPTPELKSLVRDLCINLNTVGATFTRTRKRDVPEDQAVRVPREVEVNWTEGERAFYEAVENHYFAMAQKSQQQASFIMQMPLRQACSSIPVMRDVLRRKGLNDLASVDKLVKEQDLVGFVGEEVDAENYLDALPDILAEQVPMVDSKLSALRTELLNLQNAGNKQALIFTFFRGTVEYLQKELQKDFRVGSLHGGYKPEERDKIIEDFRNGKYDIMVANQVGSEGLDFQFCNVLVNYDLPWNPMQVEQRIGRIDRFGQKSERIHIINMKVPDTIETNIFLRLYNRIDLFRESIGDLEPILQEYFDDATDHLYDPRLSPEEREKQLDEREMQIVNQRRHIQELEAEGAIQVAQSLEIEGLTSSGPAKGRYIGEGELISLIHNLLDTFGGQLLRHRESGLFTIKGSGDLANALASMTGNDVGTSLGSLLVRKIRDSEPIFVTFNSKHLLEDTDDSAHINADIISARHPLIRLATSLENETTLLPKRFSRCTITDLNLTGNFLADVSLVESDGVTPKKEIWVTAVDVETGARNVLVEDALMEAIAAGSLAESTSVGGQNETVMQQLQRQVYERRSTEESKRRSDNAALVGIRKQSEHQLNDRRIETLTAQIAEGRGIQTILKSKLVKAEDYKLAIDMKYETSRVLDLSVQPIAVVAITLV